MRRALLTPLAPIVLVGLVAACGGGGSADATTPPPASEASQDVAASEATITEADPTPGTSLDACAIVTGDDIVAATGSTSAAPTGTLEATPTSLSSGRSECTYEGDFGRILVELTPEDGANLYDAALGAYEDADLLAGLGDGAFDSAQNHRAFVWKGAVAVMLTMFLNDGEQKAVSQQLGEAIVAKL